ncbi:MAG: Gfo/Idh/MocA family oxidoreductase [Bacteroidetes bacterium]|nr:Gfo/Idh/MocA family oxidoreductase [Bacteroidota bacterium]
MNRRRFLRQSSSLMALAGLQHADILWAADDKRRRVALIGTGWYGKSDLLRLIQVSPIEVVGLCDVDRHQLEGAVQLIQQRTKNPSPIATYSHYQSLLTEQKPDIVLIGTPDHWHALQAIEAMRQGAHVYVQKPISVDVLEGEAMRAAARKYNRVVQVGLQRRSTPHLVEAKQRYIDSGLLGKIYHAEMFCHYHMRNSSNPSVQPVPEYFDYEMWTGPAPLRPFDGLPHRGWWRAFMEYGNGITGDMCVHMYDAVRWMLGLGWPTRIHASGGIYGTHTGKSNIADTQTAVFEHPGLHCTWEMKSWGAAPDPDYPWGFKIYGEKGTLCGSTTRYDLIPVGKGARLHGEALYEREKYPEDITEKDIELHVASATRAHMRDFLQCIDNAGNPVSNLEEGHISTASCILANLSMQLGRGLSYDPQRRIVTGDAEATSLLQRTYRNPWQHPHPDRV